MDGVDNAEERDRLHRVHELLVAAGPPPELSPALAAAPSAPAAEDEPDASWLPPRRIGALGLVGAALLAGAFGVGYLAGDRGSDETARPAAPAEPTTRVVALNPSDQNNTSSASVRLGRKRADGNWPMILTVRGLAPLDRGDYYTLALTRKGKPVVTCGTFNVAATGTTTIRMTAAYDLNRFEGWAITRYDAQTHEDAVVMTEV
jgi:hypothetical protein